MRWFWVACFLAISDIHLFVRNGSFKQKEGTWGTITYKEQKFEFNTTIRRIHSTCLVYALLTTAWTCAITDLIRVPSTFPFVFYHARAALDVHNGSTEAWRGRCSNQKTRTWACGTEAHQMWWYATKCFARFHFYLCYWLDYKGFAKVY